MNSNYWEKIKEKLRQELGDYVFHLWISPIKFLAIEKDIILLEVPNIFFRNWIEEHYLDKILQQINPAGELKYKIKFTISNMENAKKTKNLAIETREFEIKRKLNPRYTFEKFVIGNCNKFAHAASFAVASAPAKAYNPLFIYGGVGLGKTHLLQAIGNKILDEQKKLKVHYVSCEEFTNELITAIQARKTKQFRERYRNVDVLLIDDIHFLSGKESTQEEFFHTFNALYESHRQIVLSSDRSPKDIPDLEERLVSRFHWGLICDVIPPDFETRIAILRKKMEDVNIQINEDVIDYIAEKITSNIRELEGALMRVVAHANFFDEEPNIELAKSILKDMIKEELPRLSISHILKEVAQYFKLKPEELISKSRKKNLVLPRQISMYLAREMTDLSLKEIGENFGQKDHTTVLYACDKVANLIKSEKNIKNIIEYFKNRLKY